MTARPASILDAFRLDGKVALVTGAGRGIGAEIAQSFASVGARVFCVARTESQLAQTVAAIEDAGGEAAAHVCDLQVPDAADALVDACASRFGGLDIVVNNAGGGGHVPTKYAAEEHFEAALGLNFRAPFYVTRAAAPFLRGDVPGRIGTGAVLNISSGYSRAANIGSIPYGGAKAALEQLTRMMAMEYAPEIRVNAIRVGAVTTENMKQNLLQAIPGIGEKLAAWTPLARLGRPEDIARAALFLCSPASDYVTARVLPVDGGVVLERSAMELIERADRLAGKSWTKRLNEAFVARYGSTAIVTGAGQGIGRAFADTLARRGLDLVLVDLNRETVERAAREVAEAFGTRAWPVALDLSEREFLTELLEAIDRAGCRNEIGLVVCNAALGLEGPFLDEDLHSLRRSLDVNCRSVLDLTHAFGREMRERGRGGLLLVASGTALHGSPGYAAYAATKAFDLVLGESLWYELRDHGVDVLSFVPGPTNTPGLRKSMPRLEEGVEVGPIRLPAKTAETAIAALGRRATAARQRDHANRLAARRRAADAVYARSREHGARPSRDRKEAK